MTKEILLIAALTLTNLTAAASTFAAESNAGKSKPMPQTREHILLSRQVSVPLHTIADESDLARAGAGGDGIHHQGQTSSSGQDGGHSQKNDRRSK